MSDWTKKHPHEFAADIVNYCGMGDDEETLNQVADDVYRYVAATRAKVEAECAQRTAEAVDAARREERERVLAELDALNPAERTAFFAYRASLRKE